jgi:TATA-box binding protein (TBP) (component of TFIID and TFIIIB)
MDLKLNDLNDDINSKPINKINDTLSDISSETCSKCNDILYCNICDPKCKYLDCICAESWKNFDETLDEIKNVSSEILLESLRISTITLCFNLNSNIDIEGLSKKYVSKNNGKFYNSLIFNWHTKYQNKTIVSVKIFPNGKVQIAGLSNIKSCAYIIRKVNNKCSDYYENKKEAKITNVKIAMINSDFKISETLNLTNFCDLLSNYSVQSNGNFLSIVYQPIKYPAINTKFICNRYLENYFEHIYKHSLKKKFDKSISILIFRSGSIIITGGNDIADYLDVFKYIINIIKLNNNKLFI